jgi:hypothetical protein
LGLLDKVKNLVFALFLVALVAVENVWHSTGTYTGYEGIFLAFLIFLV